jgi:hypothetical protein
MPRTSLAADIPPLDRLQRFQLRLRQRYRERGARVGRRTDLNVATVCPYDRARDEQAKSDTVSRALPATGSERFKYERQRACCS